MWEQSGTGVGIRGDEIGSRGEASSPSGPFLLNGCALPLHIPRHVPCTCRYRAKRQTRPLITLDLTQPASLGTEGGLAGGGSTADSRILKRLIVARFPNSRLG